MTQKNYVAIARILAGDFATAQNPTVQNKVVGITLSLADYFQSDNPRFDRGRFYTAVWGSPRVPRNPEFVHIPTAGTYGNAPGGKTDHYNPNS